MIVQTFTIQEKERNSNFDAYHIAQNEYQKKWIIKAYKKEAHRSRLRKKLPFFIMFFIRVFEFFNGEWFAMDEKSVSKYMLEEEEGQALVEYKKVHKGLKVYEGKKLISSMLFKKRELVSKYEIEYKGKYLGSLEPNGVGHNKFEIVMDGKVLLKAEKLNSWFGKDMQIKVYHTFREEELLCLFGIFLF